jgi:HSP20 family protein
VFHAFIVEGTMTTTVIEKRPTEVPTKEEPFAELEPFGPGFMGTLLADMRQFAEEFDPLFAGFGLRRRGFLPTMLRAPLPAPWTPNIEVFYLGGAIVVRAELPGLKKEEITVKIVKGALTIEGERKYEKEATKKGYFTTECAYGTFYRRIPLPEEVKAGEVKATFKNGLLEVTIPAKVVPEVEKRIVEVEG